MHAKQTHLRFHITCCRVFNETIFYWKKAKSLKLEICSAETEGDGLSRLVGEDGVSVLLSIVLEKVSMTTTAHSFWAKISHPLFDHLRKRRTRKTRRTTTRAHVIQFTLKKMLNDLQLCANFCLSFWLAVKSYWPLTWKRLTGHWLMVKTGHGQHSQQVKGERNRRHTTWQTSNYHQHHNSTADWPQPGLTLIQTWRTYFCEWPSLVERVFSSV